MYSLEDFKDKEGLLVIFTCNHCPYAEAGWPLIIDLHRQFGDKIAFAAINPNDPEMYRQDSFEGMKELVKEKGVEFPYLVDETQKTAKTYKAQCTPDLYLFKKDGEAFKLYYHGRINDNWQDPEAVTEKNLEEAIKGLLAGKAAPENQAPSMGCSIKWRENE